VDAPALAPGNRAPRRAAHAARSGMRWRMLAEGTAPRDHRAVSS
jgi:hypothetical protein